MLMAGLAAAEADPVARLRFLAAEIARHDELYFRKAQPEISDFEYDRLKQEFAELRSRFPGEAERRIESVDAVGDDRLVGWTKRAHRVPMLSLEKAYSEAALRAFDRDVRAALGAERIAYVVEPKFDGLAVSAIYEHGRLTAVVTRGNGREGDDVTETARATLAIPERLRTDAAVNAPGFVELRGEIYMPLAEFARINREREEAGESLYASPRNLAAGTLKTREPAEIAERRLAGVFYGIGALDPGERAPATQAELLEQIGAWGLRVPETALRVESVDAAWAAAQAIGRARSGLAYPIDGVVVKVDARAHQRALGETAQAPRWAIACKFMPERATTRVKAIAIQVGRTGVLTPVAELEPVQLGGATIARASLHNAQEIARLDVRRGDAVIVERAGEIIPSIVGVERGARGSGSAPYVFPANCPACDAAAVRDAGEAAWRCSNPRCPAQVKRRILHFASAQGVAITGLGEATIAALVDARKVSGIADLYALTPEDLRAAAGVGATSADALIRAIEASKRTELWRFVHGLGLPRVGVVNAQALAARFETLARLAAATESELREVRGIGERTAAEIVSFFERLGGERWVAALAARGVMPANSPRAKGPLSGKTFVLTGRLPTLTRDEATRLIEAAGGRVVGEASRRMDYVVAGDGPGKALERARSLGAAVLNEEELRRLAE